MLGSFRDNPLMRQEFLIMVDRRLNAIRRNEIIHA